MRCNQKTDKTRKVQNLRANLFPHTLALMDMDDFDRKGSSTSKIKIQWQQDWRRPVPTVVVATAAWCLEQVIQVSHSQDMRLCLPLMRRRGRRLEPHNLSLIPTICQMVSCFHGEGTYNPSLWYLEGRGHGSLRVVQMDFLSGKFTKIVIGRMYDGAGGF